MKKVLAFVLALCLMTALLPMAVMAETTPTETVPAETTPTETVPAETTPVETAPAAVTSVKVKFENNVAADFSLTVEVGATAYAISNEELQFVEWKEAEAPADKFIKLELSADGVLTATLNNIHVDSSSTGYTGNAIEFPEGNYSIVLNVVGENKIQDQHSACIKYANAGGMTITGEGSLALHIGTAETTGAASGAIYATGGDLLIKNATLDFFVNSAVSSKHHAIFAAKGNVTLESSKITVNTQGGQLVFFGTDTAKTGRHTIDESTDRYITVKDCEIDAQVKISVFESTNPAVISGTTMTVCKSSSSHPMFTPAPVFEGPYTAVAGLLKNKDNPAKLKEYSEKKLGSYTYLSVVPYVVEQPTEPTTEATEPVVIVPEVTEPVVTEPKATEPVATEPKATEPAATEPQETTPATTEATEPTDDTSSSNPIMVFLIIMIVLVVIAGATLGILIVLKKKKA